MEMLYALSIFSDVITAVIRMWSVPVVPVVFVLVNYWRTRSKVERCVSAARVVTHPP